MPEPAPQPATEPGPHPAPPQPSPQPMAPPAANSDAKAQSSTLAKSPTCNARLLDSIDDAYALLDFAARRGMKPDDAVTAPIIESHAKVSSGAALSASEEAVFWNAFSTIIDMVKPVTLESILFTSEHTERTPHSMLGKWRSHLRPADRVLRRYLLGAALSLMALLALQVEWAIGMSTYNDAFKVHGNLQATNDKVSEAEQLNDALAVNSTTAATTLNAKAQLQILQNQQNMDQSWDDVSYVRLWWWNRQMASFIPPYDLSIDRKGPPNEAGEVKLDNEGLRRIEFTRAQLTLEVISDYILVTLFALLGSMTQALRSLSAQIASVSLTTNSLYRIRTRIILGVISGVCMAWLLIISTGDTGGNIKPGVEAVSASSPLTSISFLGAFTPWAIAFISGYSVEIFFAALERAITIITSRIQASPPPDAPQIGASPTQAAVPASTSPSQAPPTQSNGGASAKAPAPPQPQPQPQSSVTQT